jgi:hypothetical protein
MGFRDYSPGLNRFTTRDMYNGALADMRLVADPYTGNRYAFGGGNPVGSVELDGHRPADCNKSGYTCSMNSAGGWGRDRGLRLRAARHMHPYGVGVKRSTRPPGDASSRRRAERPPWTRTARRSGPTRGPAAPTAPCRTERPRDIRTGLRARSPARRRPPNEVLSARLERKQQVALDDFELRGSSVG